MTGRGKHFVVALDRHVLDVGIQRAPQTIDQGQCLRVGFRQRREDHLVAAEQCRIGSFHATLLGTRDRMPRHEAWQTLGERLASGTHHVAFGTAHIGDHRIAQVKLSQTRQKLLHGQDRHRQLDDVGADTGGGEVFLAAIDHAKRHGLLARLGIEIDTDHFAAQAAFAQALGERAADQAEADHDQPTDKRCGLFCYSINHECEPCSEI